ncbi:MAG: sugar-binding domain-containing protein [Actinomycetaceae bacterium]|nr:sugar-binding domain-containing protein [Actinomycetaceae bacterium]
MDDQHLRLAVKVARLYHERKMKQAQIASELHISQPRVSRLLKEAALAGIVRTIVTVPNDIHTDIEDALTERYGLNDCIVADAGDSDEEIGAALAGAAATYLQTTLTGGDTIGISSWSATWLSAVDRLPAFSTPVADQVVQMFGGVGNPAVQVKATRLIDRLARATGAKAVFFPSPSVLGSNSAAQKLREDPSVISVSSLGPSLTVSLAGIGSLDPSPLLRESGNSAQGKDAEKLRALGAVGDVCLRYYDKDGVFLPSDFDARLVGMDVETIRSIPRRVAVAGGQAKIAAIRGALLGGWLTVLITDIHTARALLS